MRRDFQLVGGLLFSSTKDTEWGLFTVLADM
jgi:hypothetical protein